MNDLDSLRQEAEQLKNAIRVSCDTMQTADTQPLLSCPHKFYYSVGLKRVSVVMKVLQLGSCSVLTSWNFAHFGQILLDWMGSKNHPEL